MKQQIILLFLGITLLASVASFSPIPVDAQFDYEKEFGNLPKDSDNDGWADYEDDCPTVPGNVYGSFNGCPPDGSGGSGSSSTQKDQDPGTGGREIKKDDPGDIFNIIDEIIDEIFETIDDIIKSIFNFI